jgi:hypothetical protein
MNKFCHSCGMPLTGQGDAAANGNFCGYCTDGSGNLHPKEAVKQGIIQFLGSWAPQKEGMDLAKRAEHYMAAMPAWSDN